MANFIDSFNVNTAITTNSKLDLGHSHITTANFMQLSPILCKEMVPGETVSVDLMTFSRMQPLSVPTFGRANIKERAFFVPMRTIWKGWNDFITDTPHVYSEAKAPVNIIDNVPLISNFNLVYAFIPNEELLDIRLASIYQNAPSVYDTQLIAADGTVEYVVFTSYGRQALKVLQSLGYRIIWDLRNTEWYSAMPLLAFTKIVLDWYYPNQYVNTNDYVALKGVLVSDEAVMPAFDATTLNKILKNLLYVNYDSDYFVSAWDNPVAPTNGVYSTFNIVDITTNGASPSGMGNSGNWYAPYSSISNTLTNIGVSNVASNGTPVSVMDVNASGVVTGGTRLGMSVSDYQHTALKALTDYLKRHQLVGARAIDRYLARFGKTLSAEKMNRCNYIGSKMIPLQISDVMSTSNTVDSGGYTDTGLGEFAGKGIAFEESFNFDWTTDEYGYVIILSSIVPAAGMFQGLNRHVEHIKKLDFWTPEFDNLGVQAISTREVYTPTVDTNLLSAGATSYCAFDGAVFGFAPRYGEYKYINDQVTGDFVVNTLNVGNSNKSAWHLCRMIDTDDFTNAGRTSWTNLTHSRNFVNGLRDNYQYSRIFTYYPADQKNMPDPFTLIYNFNMVSQSPMKPLYETYEFEDKGKKVQEQVNGVKLN